MNYTRRPCCLLYLRVCITKYRNRSQGERSSWSNVTEIQSLLECSLYNIDYVNFSSVAVSVFVHTDRQTDRQTDTRTDANKNSTASPAWLVDAQLNVWKPWSHVTLIMSCWSAESTRTCSSSLFHSLAVFVFFMFIFSYCTCVVGNWITFRETAAIFFAVITYTCNLVVVIRSSCSGTRRSTRLH